MKDQTFEEILAPERFPEELEIAFGQGGQRRTLTYQRVKWPVDGGAAGLRYGENPSQPAALYRLVNGFLAAADVAPLRPDGRLASEAELLQAGKLPSKTGVRSVDIALSVLRYTPDQATCVLVKHANPCGAARAANSAQAFIRAAMANRTGAVGACAAFNRRIGPAAAEAILSVQLDIVAAPDFEPDALAALARQPNLSLLRIGEIARLAEWAGRLHLELTSLLDGGLIVQWGTAPAALTREDCRPATATLHRAQEVRCKRQPTNDEWDDLLFAWHLAAATASDSIVLVKDGATVSIGIAGQDRTAGAEAARDKAYRKLADRLAWERFKTPFNALTDEPMRESIWTDAVELRGGLIGAAMASDGAISSIDALEGVFKEGVTAVIQPGGAPHDGELIRLCNEYNAAMVFTGRRAFRH